jgi:hypothetical protein
MGRTREAARETTMRMAAAHGTSSSIARYHARLAKEVT